MVLGPTDLSTFEQHARALAEVWMTGMPDASRQGLQVDRILAASSAADRPHLAALSMAFEATVTIVVCTSQADAAARVAALFDEVRKVGWQRATRLAEAALSWAQSYHAELGFTGPPLELAHGESKDHPRHGSGRLVVGVPRPWPCWTVCPSRPTSC